MNTPLTRRDAILLALGASAAAPLASCARARARAADPRPRPGPSRIVPLETRVDAIPGLTLVLPVRVEGSLPTHVDLTLGRAGGMRAELVWLGVRHDPGAPPGWLPNTGAWIAVPSTESTIPESVGAWHLVAPLTREAVGENVSIGAARLPINWLSHPDDLAPPRESGALWEPWCSPVPLGRVESAHLRALTAPERDSPLRAWRWRFIATGLDLPPPRPGSGDASPDPLLALAAQIDARWRIALARLWYADPGACETLRRTLARTLDLGEGVYLPAFPVEQASLDGLLDDLLNPALTGQSLAEAANAWRAALPAGLAWVESDASRTDADSTPLASLSVANLDDHATMAWVASPSGPRLADPLAIPAASVQRFVIPARTDRVRAHAGAWSRDLMLNPTLAARPPGARCAPFLHDWTLAALVSGRDSLDALPPIGARTAALLDRGARPGDGWSIFLECEGEPEDPDADRVMISLGPAGAPLGLIRVNARGEVRDELTGADAPPIQPVVARGKWALRVGIPDTAIERGAHLRLGLVRVDPAGRRSAWPRRMMPGQTDPARAHIDLTAWSGLPG